MTLNQDTTPYTTFDINSPLHYCFWNAEKEKLPVEKGDYEIELPAINWKIIGCNNSGNVKVIIAKNRLNYAKIKSMTNGRKFMERIMGRPYRPGNYRAKYVLKEYRADVPFFVKGGKD